MLYIQQDSYCVHKLAEGAVNVEWETSIKGGNLQTIRAFRKKNIISSYQQQLELIYLPTRAPSQISEKEEKNLFLGSTTGE